MLKTLGAAGLAILVLASCSAAPRSSVFHGTRPAPDGTFISGMVLAGRGYIYDIMVPDLHNHTTRSVRLTSIRVVSPHLRAVHVLSITAYPWSRITSGTAFVDEGDLSKGCPKEFAPHPVTDVVVAPHSDANYVLYIALTLLKPGRYNFGKTIVSYVTDGRRGSEVYYLPNIHLRTVSRRANPHLYEPDVC